MNLSASCRTLALAGLAVLVANEARGGPVQTAFSQPSLDRWNYPFNSTPGLRVEASAFGSINIAGFDDRDAQFLIGFNTSGVAAPGQGSANYVVLSVRVRATISQGDRFVYDPTWDSVASSYATTDPLYQADTDAGKPIEVFGVGYRGGYGPTTTGTTTEFCETCPFGGAPVVPPAEGCRFAFPALFDGAGAATDISRQVRQYTEAVPMGIGRTTAVQPGQIVPAGTEFTFDINLCDPAARAYVQRALDAGRLNFMITSLHPTAGPTSTQYPVFYTKENPLSPTFGYSAKLEIVVNQGRRSDADNDGMLTVNDFVTYLNQYAASNPAADVDDNCLFNVNDFVTFMNLYAAGR